MQAALISPQVTKPSMNCYSLIVRSARFDTGSAHLGDWDSKSGMNWPVNRPTRSPRLIAGRNSGSWRIVANPDITPLSGYIRVDGHPPATHEDVHLWR